MRRLLLLLTFNVILRSVFAQGSIEGNIKLDSTWSSRIFLSYIPSFSDMYTINYSLIIDEAPINDEGYFRFPTSILPEEDRLYRLHIVKKEAPAASLVIGGSNENHIFMIAKKDVSFKLSGRHMLSFPHITFYNSVPNAVISRVGALTTFADTTNFSVVKEEFIRQVLSDQLRHIADTTTNELASLYALNQINLEEDVRENEDFYRDYFQARSSNSSSYLKELRRRINLRPSNDWIYYLTYVSIGFISGALTLYAFNKIKSRKRTVQLNDLSVQERKIFSLLQKGLSNKEIAAHANIEVSTVKSHINNIFSKLHISSRKDILDLDL